MSSEKKRLIVKIILILVIAVVALIGVALWQLDRIVETSTRTIGSMVTGTEVDVKSVSVKPLAGQVRISGFTVGNPAGFHNPHAIKVGNFQIAMKIGSIFSDKLEIDYLELSGVAVDFEYTFSQGSNLDVLLKNVEKNTGADKKKAAAEEKAPAEPEKEKAPAKKVVIRKLVFKDSLVSVSSGAVRTSLKVPLLPIEMSNVGENTDLAGAVSDVLTRLLTEVLKVVDVKQLGKSLSDVGESVLKGIDKSTEAIGAGVVSAGDSAGNAVQDTLQKSKNMIKALPGLGR